jgi:hypothetical protein
MAKSFRGHVWVDEVLREVVRVEGTAIETLSYGLGMVARLGRGATVVLTDGNPRPANELAKRLNCRAVDWVVRHSVSADLLINCTPLDELP